MYRQAIDEMEKTLQLSGGNMKAIFLIGYTYAVSGDRKLAEKLLGELKALSNQKYVPASHVAMIY
jgi:Flp pilus assembly protein TadD